MSSGVGNDFPPLRDAERWCQHVKEEKKKDQQQQELVERIHKNFARYISGVDTFDAMDKGAVDAALHLVRQLAHGIAAATKILLAMDDDDVSKLVIANDAAIGLIAETTTLLSELDAAIFDPERNYHGISGTEDVEWLLVVVRKWLRCVLGSGQLRIIRRSQLLSQIQQQHEASSLCGANEKTVASVVAAFFDTVCGVCYKAAFSFSFPLTDAEQGGGSKTLHQGTWERLVDTLAEFCTPCVAIHHFSHETCETLKNASNWPNKLEDLIHVTKPRASKGGTDELAPIRDAIADVCIPLHRAVAQFFCATNEDLSAKANTADADYFVAPLFFNWQESGRFVSQSLMDHKPQLRHLCPDTTLMLKTTADFCPATSSSPFFGPLFAAAFHKILTAFSSFPINTIAQLTFLWDAVTLSGFVTDLDTELLRQYLVLRVASAAIDKGFSTPQMFDENSKVKTSCTLHFVFMLRIGAASNPKSFVQVFRAYVGAFEKEIGRSHYWWHDRRQYFAKESTTHVQANQHLRRLAEKTTELFASSDLYVVDQREITQMQREVDCVLGNLALRQVVRGKDYMYGGSFDKNDLTFLLEFGLLHAVPVYKRTQFMPKTKHHEAIDELFSARNTIYTVSSTSCAYVFRRRAPAVIIFEIFLPRICSEKDIAKFCASYIAHAICVRWLTLIRLYNAARTRHVYGDTDSEDDSSGDDAKEVRNNTKMKKQKNVKATKKECTLAKLPKDVVLEVTFSYIFGDFAQTGIRTLLKRHFHQCDKCIDVFAGKSR